MAFLFVTLSKLHPVDYNPVFFFSLNLSLFSRTVAMTLTNGQVTCIAREMVLKRQVSDAARSELASPTPS